MQVGQEVLDGVGDDHLAPPDMLVDLALSGLPASVLEPRFGGWHGEGRAQLEHTVLSFGDLHLGALALHAMS